jgi:predicted alpha/beta hydrolase
LTLQTINLPDNTQTQVCWVEKGKASKGVILFLPALGVSIDYYKSLAELWSQRSFAIALVESRSMRYSLIEDVKLENFGYKEVLDVDLATIIPALCQRRPNLPVWLCGHSLGGQFALLHASEKLSKLAGLILIAAGSNHYATLPTSSTRWKRRVGIRLIRVINGLLGYFPGHKLGFGGRQPKNMMKDWTFEGLKGRYLVCGSNKDYNQLLARLELPILMISLSGDPLVPKSSADVLADKLLDASVTQVELIAKDYGLAAFNHFKWAKKPEPVLDAIEQWLSSTYGTTKRGSLHRTENISR